MWASAGTPGQFKMQTKRWRKYEIGQAQLPALSIMYRRIIISNTTLGNRSRSASPLGSNLPKVSADKKSFFLHSKYDERFTNHKHVVF
jgi:hypothetical protein